MLHVKFQDHKTFGSGEDFKSFLLYIGIVAILSWSCYVDFRSPISMRLQMKFGFDWPSR